MGGTNLGEWIQLPPPKTYKQKYLKLKEMIHTDLDLHRDSIEYRRAYEVLQSLVMCIEYMDKESKK